MHLLPGQIGYALAALDRAVETVLCAEPGELPEAIASLGTARGHMREALRWCYGRRPKSASSCSRGDRYSVHNSNVTRAP